MKLSHVVFKHLVNVPGQGSGAEFNGAIVPIEYDHFTDMVRIGVDPIDVPRADVVQWKRDRVKDNAKQVCNVCSKQFNNRQALGAHKAFRHPTKVTAA